MSRNFLLGKKVDSLLTERLKSYYFPQMKVVLGVMTFSRQCDEPTSNAMLDAFIAHSAAPEIDSAIDYPTTSMESQTEQLLGRRFAREPTLRKQLKIASKVRSGMLLTALIDIYRSIHGVIANED